MSGSTRYEFRRTNLRVPLPAVAGKAKQKQLLELRAASAGGKFRQTQLPTAAQPPNSKFVLRNSSFVNLYCFPLTKRVCCV